MSYHSTVSNPQAATAVLPSKDKIFRIGLIVKDRGVPENYLAAIASYWSLCELVAVAVLSQNEPFDATPVEELIRNYDARRGQPTAHPTPVLYGEDSFRQVIESDGVDAVYVFVPYECNLQYAIAALEAHKHVLLDDPVSTALDEFRQQLACAVQVKRFVQFATTFVHHHRVTSFLGCVLREKFGAIQAIDVRLNVNFDDVFNIGVTLPLKPGYGCIRRLGRYCALIAALMLTPSGSRPMCAKVLNATLSETGEPVSARCVVTYTGNQVLKLHVGYTNAHHTRQILEVRSRQRYATMTDFVIPHPDGLANYRTYEKEPNPLSGKLELVSGEALDVPLGPSQGIMMWRHFRELCASVEMDGWAETPETLNARDITSVALQTKRVLLALEQSLKDDFAEVRIPVEDFDI